MYKREKSESTQPLSIYVVTFFIFTQLKKKERKINERK